MRVFTLMVGLGVPQGLVIGSENNPVGLASDTMMTVADILGVGPEVQSAGLTVAGTTSLFNHI